MAGQINGAAINTLKEIRDCLETILRVVSIEVGADRSLTERVRLLKLAGVDNRTIADILDTTEGTVRALGANLRGRRRSRFNRRRL